MVLPTPTPTPGSGGGTAPKKTPTPRPGPKPTAPSALSPYEQNAADKAKRDAQRDRTNRGMTPTEKNAATRARNEKAAQDSKVSAQGATTIQTPAYALSNKPLHPLTESPFIYGRDGVGLRRGAIVQMKTDASSGRLLPAAKRYVFRFLFNPETVAFGNQSLASVLDPSARNSLDIGSILMTGQESTTFSLLLDRTQEAYIEGIKTRGTLDDVEALYRVCNGNIGSAAGFLSLSAVEIQWGPTIGNSAHPLPPFPCYITSIDVTHTHFTPRMCPIRTALTISATRLVGGITATASGAASVGAAAT